MGFPFDTETDTGSIGPIYIVGMMESAGRGMGQMENAGRGTGETNAILG
jgi:hypothetical protein